MTSRDFCYWLQGYIEIFEADTQCQQHGLHPKQLECVRNHLAMVFKHEIDPSMGPKPRQDILNQLHSPSHNGPPVMRC